MGRKPVSNITRQQILALFQTGKFSYRQIGSQLNVSARCVENTVHRFRSTGTPKERPRSGRPKKLEGTASRQLKRAVKKCRESRRRSLRAIASEYSESTGMDISYETVRKSLHASNLHHYAATHRPTLKVHHREARLAWRKERANWGLLDWESIIWSDESHFTLQPGKGAVRLWREPEEALHEDCMQHKDIGAGGAVTVWGCFSSDMTGVLLVTRGTVDTVKYIEILENGLLPSLDLFGFQLGDPNWFYQQDNARPHTSAAARAWFTERNITLLPWPAKSPDLSPIERLWALLDRRVRGLRIENLEQLEDALVNAWCQIPKETLRNLSHCMPRRVARCIAAKGGHF